MKTAKQILLAHFSDNPPEVVSLRSYNDAPWSGYVSAYNKPWGFWLSDESRDDGWSHWCQSEAFDIGSIKTEYLLSLEGVLHLKDDAELWAFTQKYGFDTDWSNGAIQRMAINWRRVQAEYKGILITPYVWSSRHSLDWYYGWDCASACIWEPSCLKLREAAELA